jgi:hypothetical protein
MVLSRRLESLLLRSETADDSGGQKRFKSAKNPEATATEGDDSTPSIMPVEVPAGDSVNRIEVTSSDKLGNKPDPDLAEIIAPWPGSYPPLSDRSS